MKVNNGMKKFLILVLIIYALVGISFAEEDITKDLKLDGYTIDDEKIIEKIDSTYEDSQIIKFTAVRGDRQVAPLAIQIPNKCGLCIDCAVLPAQEGAPSRDLPQNAAQERREKRRRSAAQMK